MKELRKLAENLRFAKEVADKSPKIDREKVYGRIVEPHFDFLVSLLDRLEKAERDAARYQVLRDGKYKI